VQNFLQRTYPQFYSDSGQYWVFYDGKNVNFEIPDGKRTYGNVPASSRLFAVAFDDPGHSLVQDFDPNEVAQISVYDKADELAHIIWKVKSLTGAPRVIVVAHSLGGLVSRAYIEELPLGLSGDRYWNDISTLVTLDTPHGGTWLGALNTLTLGACWAQDSTNKREMKPNGTDSIIPQINYFIPGATALPPTLRAYSIASYWTIHTPLGLIDPIDKGADNVLYYGEQDLYSNLNNPSVNSKSNLFEVNNAFDALFDLCGSIHIPPYVLHYLTCTGNASQTFRLIENEIRVPAVMTQAVSLTASSPTVPPGGTVQMATLPPNRAVIWSILEGPTAGSINKEGLYTAGESIGQFHVVAIDSVKSNDYGIATVTVTQ
jgi:pimeloyl-ACP methyl ester carboxylesterase